MTALLEAKNLHITFGAVKAANGVDLHIDEGEFLAIIGPNGSGKTTFLNLCTGYIRPSEGEVYLDGKPITRLPPRTIARKGIARAFQIPQLFLDQTVLTNLMLAIASREGVWQAGRALDRLAGGGETRPYNLGTGSGVSVREILDGIEKVTGKAVPHRLGPRRPGDPPVLVSDPSRARAELGWEPRMSDIETIIATAWAWHQKGAE